MNINQYILKNKLNIKNFISLEYVSEEDICEILHIAKEMKNKHRVHEKQNELADKYILLITKPDMIKSIITFEISVQDLGGKPIVITQSGDKLDTFLSDSDYIRSISQNNLSSIFISTSIYEDYEKLTNNLEIPIVNANSTNSPIEALSILFSIWEDFHSFNNINVSIIGDANNEDNCLLFSLIKMGINVTLISPENCQPSIKTKEYCSQFCEMSITSNLYEGIKNANYIYIKGGQNSASTYKITRELLNNCKNDIKLFSTIPTDKNILSQFENLGSFSLLSKQTENLIYIEKAILFLISKSF